LKYSLAWLNRYVDLSAVNLDELANRFTLSVAELEGVERVGDGLEPVVVARIIEAEPHPAADRLQVCTVEDGSGVPRTVVCGAPNARAGLTTALAPPGTDLGPIQVKTAEIRGVESAGMLCSARELGLTDEHEGILELPSGWIPGTQLNQLLPVTDVLLEVDNKSITHRPDLWGHYGVARELAGLFGGPLRPPNCEVQLGSVEPAEVEISEPERCPRYCALGLEGISIEPAPLWMQTLLHRCGTRPINNVVDVTNFTMLELGNPLHAFDAREVQGDKIHVRVAEEGETVVTLDDQERTLTDQDLLICDGARPVALAGVMGLANSEVRDDTTKLLLESANFKAESVRRTAIRVGLRTEASARFEKSLDAELPPVAALRFAALLQEIQPAVRVYSGLVDANFSKQETRVIETSVSYINRRLGTTLSVAQVHAYLTSIEFTVEDVDGDTMKVGVPSFRATKDISIAEDLVEEVGRLFGYDNVTPVQPAVEIPKPYRHPDRSAQRRVRMALSFGADCAEIKSYSFDYEPFLDRIGRGDWGRIKVRNPISAEQTHLRGRLIPGVLQALERSSANAKTVRMYEIGRVFEPGGDELPPQPFHLSLGLWRHPSVAPKGDDADHQRAAYAELKGVLEFLMDRLQIAVRFERVSTPDNPWIHPVRAASIVGPNGATLGTLGSFHPDLVEALEIGSYGAVAELNMDQIRALANDDRCFDPIAKYPPIPFDLSVIVPEAVTHQELLDRILEAKWVQAADCTAVYRGEQIPEDQKSMSYRILFQSHEATLSMEEVNTVIEELVQRLSDELGGWLRL